MDTNMRFLLALLLAFPLLGQTVATFTGPDGTSRAYTLKGHPRVWFDGPGGTISTRLADPDGSGPLRNANYDRLPAQGMISRASTTRNNCLVGGVIKNCSGVETMASDAAFLWYMCNQCTVPWSGSTTWLDYSKDLYLNFYAYGIKRWFGSSKFGDALATDAGDDPSGITDYGGVKGAFAAAGYSVIRNQLTSGERTTIANYFINGLLPEDFCALPSVRAGVRVSQDTKGVLTILDGASWPSGTDVGDWIDVKAYKDSSGNVLTTNAATNGYWSMSSVVQAKTATTITIKNGSGASYMPNFQEGFIFTYPAFQANTCGFMHVFLTHSDTPRYVEPPSSQNTRALAADVPADAWDVTDTDGVTRVITISDTSAWNIDGFSTPSPSAPWKAVLGGGGWEAEMVHIEGVSGGNVTIRRGLYHHPNRVHLRCGPWDPACSSPRGITVFSKVSSGTRNYNTGLNNREITRSQSVLALALAFADDDARALEMLERSADYFGTDSQKWAERFFSLTNYSIGSYQWDRGVYYNRMAFFLKNSIASPSVDYYDTGENASGQYYAYAYWHLPWDADEVPGFGLDGNYYSCYWDLNMNRDCGQLAFMAQLTHPGSDAAKYAWSFLTGVNTYTLSSTASVWGSTDYYEKGMITWLGMLAGYPNDIQSAADRTALTTSYTDTHGDSQSPGGSGFKFLVSRTDWTSSSTYVIDVAHDAFSDKLTGEGTMVGYGVGKNGWHIYSPGFRQRYNNNFHSSLIDFGNETKAPYYVACTPTAASVATDGLCDHHNYPSYSTAKPSFVWKASELSGMHKGGYGNLNLHGLNRHWRQITHLKAAGTALQDYVIVMDDVDKTVSERWRSRTMYMQNGETVTSASGDRTYTEGNTLLASDFSYVDSRTGTQEGGVTKMLTRWVPSGGATVAGVNNMPVKITASSSSSKTLTVCADASVSYPCRIKIGSDEYSFTAAIGTLTWNPADDSDLREIVMSFKPSTGVVNVRYDAGIPTTPTCGGSVVCVGEIAGGNGAAWTEALTTQGEYLLYRHKWSFSGDAYDDCLRDQTKRTGTPNFHVGNCNQSYNPNTTGFAAGKYDNATPVNVEMTPGTGGRLWMVHKVSSNTGITLAAPSIITVTGTGTNHEGVQVNDGSGESFVAVMPIANARAPGATFTTTYTGNGRVLVCGLQESSTYKIQRASVDVATGLVTSAEEHCIIGADLASGAMEVIRTSGETGTLAANLAAVSASCVQGGSNPSNQSLNISGSGVTLGSWSAAVLSSAPWFGFTPTSGSGNATITLSFNCTGLSANNYSTTLRLTAAQGDISNSPMDLTVSLTVSAPGGINLTLSSASLTFATTEGAGNPANQTTNLAASGGTLDNFTVNEVSGSGCAALTVSPGSGSANATLTFSVNNTGLVSASSPYVCNGTITSTTSGVLNSPLAWTATINVAASAAATLSLGGPLSYTATVGGANPANQTLNFSASSAIDNWSSSITYSQGSGWLSLSPSSGTNYANITASVDVSGLTVDGQYCATVSIASTDPDVTNSPQTASVCVTMAAAALPPNIEVPEPAGLVATLGQASAITFSVESGTGTAPFVWAVENTSPTPPGMSLSSAFGTTTSLSGTPTTIGDYLVTMTLADDDGLTDEVEVLIKIRPLANAADIEVNVLPFEGGAIFHIRKSGLNASQSCRAVVRDGEGIKIADSIVPPGPAVRTVVFTQLVSTSPYTYEVSCPTGTIASPSIIGARGIFTVDAVSGATASYGLSLTPPAGRSIVGVDVYMGANEAEVASGGVTPTRLTCANPDPCEGSISKAKGFYFYRHVWRDGSDNNKGDSGVKKVRVR